MTGLYALEKRLVVPYYLDMMDHRAVDLEPSLRGRIVGESKRVTVEDVRALLPAGWRPMVMGTWFALALPAEEVRDVIVRAVTASEGSLTAPPLAVVSTLVAGEDGVPAMTVYLERIGRADLMDRSVMSAAIAHLGGRPPVMPSLEAIELFEGILTFGRGLREEFKAVRSQ